MNIDNINLLKITKIKPWAIHFSYDGKKYLLHESTQDCETSLTLFEKIYTNEKFSLIAIKSKYGGMFETKRRFNSKTPQKNIVYKQNLTLPPKHVLKVAIPILVFLYLTLSRIELIQSDIRCNLFFVNIQIDTEGNIPYSLIYLMVLSIFSLFCLLSSSLNSISDCLIG
jgi:hypothetical protein